MQRSYSDRFDSSIIVPVLLSSVREGIAPSTADISISAARSGSSCQTLPCQMVSASKCRTVNCVAQEERVIEGRGGGGDTPVIRKGPVFDTDLASAQSCSSRNCETTLLFFLSAPQRRRQRGAGRSVVLGRAQYSHRGLHTHSHTLPTSITPPPSGANSCAVELKR